MDDAPTPTEPAPEHLISTLKLHQLRGSAAPQGVLTSLWNWTWKQMTARTPAFRSPPAPCQGALQEAAAQLGAAPQFALAVDILTHPGPGHCGWERLVETATQRRKEAARHMIRQIDLLSDGESDALARFEVELQLLPLSAALHRELAAGGGQARLREVITAPDRNEGLSHCAGMARGGVPHTLAGMEALSTLGYVGGTRPRNGSPGPALDAFIQAWKNAVDPLDTAWTGRPHTPLTARPAFAGVQCWEAETDSAEGLLRWLTAPGPSRALLTVRTELEEDMLDGNNLNSSGSLTVEIAGGLQLSPSNRAQAAIGTQSTDTLCALALLHRPAHPQAEWNLARAALFSSPSARTLAPEGAVHSGVWLQQNEEKDLIPCFASLAGCTQGSDQWPVIRLVLQEWRDRLETLPLNLAARITERCIEEAIYLLDQLPGLEENT